MKYCEILNDKVHWIFENDSIPSYLEDLNLQDITERYTFEGCEIIEGCYYDKMHDLYFNSESEYKNFQELILIYLEDLSLMNYQILKENQKILKEIDNKINYLEEINEKIDSLANLSIFLKNA